MKLLVCGGAGFIGSTFVRLRVLESGDEVTVLDKLTYAGREENFHDLAEHPRFRFLRGSIESGTFTEDSPLRSSSPYSATKAGADLLVQSYFRTYELPTFICRGSNNYGPYQYPEKLIPLMILNALHGDPLPVYGDGMQV